MQLRETLRVLLNCSLFFSLLLLVLPPTAPTAHIRVFLWYSPAWLLYWELAGATSFPTCGKG